jgi:hypothetical protein
MNQDNVTDVEIKSEEIAPQMQLRYVVCPKHGEHADVIISNIEGHEGTWCQLCWLESLGPSLPYKTK